MAIFKANTEIEFNKVVSNLKKLGCVWATDFPNHEPTFKECKGFYHGNSKLLIHTFFNDITNRHEMSAATMSVLTTYPQYKGLNLKKEIRS